MVFSTSPLSGPYLSVLVPLSVHGVNTCAFCFPFCFSLIRLARNSSILFIFPKNQLQALLIFSIKLFSASLLSTLIFVILFFLLSLCLLSSNFLSQTTQDIHFQPFFFSTRSAECFDFTVILLSLCPTSFNIQCFHYHAVQVFLKFLLSFILQHMSYLVLFKKC